MYAGGAVSRAALLFRLACRRANASAHQLVILLLGLRHIGNGIADLHGLARATMCRNPPCTISYAMAFFSFSYSMTA
jgi:hypothetical protein